MEAPETGASGCLSCVVPIDFSTTRSLGHRRRAEEGATAAGPKRLFLLFLLRLGFDVKPLAPFLDQPRPVFGGPGKIVLDHPDESVRLFARVRQRYTPQQ